MSKKTKLTPKQREACLIVERLCRAVGRDCQVIFTDDGVSIAPLEWGGDETGRTLDETLEEALNADQR